MSRISVVDYDPEWPATFAQLKEPIAVALGPLAISIEHVGSTSVPGLAAKPVIDMTIITRLEDQEKAIERLATVGYQHRGNLGVEGREAFQSPPDLPAHHLYLCPEDSPGLINHLHFRDHLRSHPETAQLYGSLKKDLASRFPHDIDSYIEGKTRFIMKILSLSQLTEDELKAIARANGEMD